MSSSTLGPRTGLTPRTTSESAAPARVSEEPVAPSAAPLAQAQPALEEAPTRTIAPRDAGEERGRRATGDAQAREALTRRLPAAGLAFRERLGDHDLPPPRGADPGAALRARRAEAEAFAGTVTAQLPAGTDPTVSERVSARARAFHDEVKELAKPGGDLEKFKAGLDPKLFGDNPRIEMQGVAADNKYESTQLHGFDKAGARHVYVRDSEGKWQERDDLAKLADAGKAPLSAPGRSTKADGTQTFATATLKDGKPVFAVEKDLAKRFDHRPVARQREVGDRVQVRSGKNEDRKMELGAEYRPGEKTDFGTIKSYDGKGTWKVEVAGKTVDVTDRDMRKANNPNFLTPKDNTHGATFDPSKDPDKKMIQAFDAFVASSDKYQGLKKPGQDASVGERVAWEKEMIQASLEFTGKSLRYPNSSKKDYDEAKVALDKSSKELKADDDVKQQLAALKADAAPSAAVTKKIAALTMKELPKEKREQIERATASHERGISSYEAPLQRRDAAATELKKLSGDRATTVGEPELKRLDADIESKQKELAAAQKIVDANQKYGDHLQHTGNAPIGAYFENGTGQCRHSAVMMQALLQHSGIDARMTWGTANTAAGIFRGGTHLWQEATLSNGEQRIVDGTWGDTLPLEATYRGEKQRQSLPDHSDTYNDSLTHKAPTPPRRFDVDPRERIA